MKPELPIIPKQAAKFIEFYKSNYSLSKLFMDSENFETTRFETKWVIQHQEITARAWLDGYRVEEDK